MFDRLGKIFRKFLVLLSLVLAAYAGWRWGPQVFPRVHEWLGLDGRGGAQGTVATPELADSVLARVQLFRREEGPSQLVLGADELTSVLRYSAPELMPVGVVDPEVTFKDGRVHFRSRVALTSFPDLPDLGPILGILPDTLDVTVQAAMMPFGNGTAVLLVHRLEASRIPLPGRLVPEILLAMGRKDRPGLPPEALLVRLPPGLSSAYILADSLFLSRDP
jgi:hypothetical protein